MSDLCALCFPGATELARLTENVQAGRTEPFVGTGDPGTVLSCAHGSWVLGDVLAPAPRACPETTKAGEPCKGTPGDDGYCPAHKPKGDDSAEPAAGADQAEGQGPGQGEEGSTEEGPGQEAGS